ncbi:MAG TPA: DUF4920 domain-containing protein [Ignavibacteria bacterium]|nr:DUF4920 domain-containing protein [Ignavibacteria bacterium]
MKSLLVLLFVALTATFATAQESGSLFGKNINESAQVVSLSDLFTNAETYNGKEIVVTGEITDVCQKAGCWVTFTDGENIIRVRTDHNFFVPKDASNVSAKVNGVFVIKEISEDKAKHYNDESINKKDPSTIVGPQKVYEITATGIYIGAAGDSNSVDIKKDQSDCSSKKTDCSTKKEDCTKVSE